MNLRKDNTSADDATHFVYALIGIVILAITSLIIH